MATNTILHGQDLGKAKSIRIKVVKARRSPEEWKAKFILDIEPVCEGRNAWPVNKSNTAILRAEFGGIQKAEGKVLELTRTDNSGNGFPDGLEITGVVAANGKARAVAAANLEDDEDVPF